MNNSAPFSSCCPIHRGQLRWCALSRQINKKWAEIKAGSHWAWSQNQRLYMLYSSQELNCSPTKLNKRLAEGSFKIISRFNRDKSRHQTEQDTALWKWNVLFKIMKRWNHILGDMLERIVTVVLFHSACMTSICSICPYIWEQTFNTPLQYIILSIW